MTHIPEGLRSVTPHLKITSHCHIFSRIATTTPNTPRSSEEKTNSNLGAIFLFIGLFQIFGPPNSISNTLYQLLLLHHHYVTPSPSITIITSLVPVASPSLRHDYPLITTPTTNPTHTPHTHTASYSVLVRPHH